jgi:uncharacterized protein YbjQ (UPF0145 family)
MAEIASSGTWASALSTAEFTAIRSAGFEPAGQVLGAAVFNVGYPGGASCPTYGARGDQAIRSYSHARGYGRPQVFTQISGSGMGSAFGPLVNTLYAARRKAIARMSAECQALGGHGVVGVSLRVGPFPEGGIEFTAMGTAVRAPGAPSLPAPFTSDLSGQEFAKLIMMGYAPVSLVLGISIGVRHDDWLTAGQTRWAMGNVEVTGYTELVNRTRQDARNELMLDVSRVCADGVVIEHADLRLAEQKCKGVDGARDHRAEVTMVGTAITRFSRTRRIEQRASLPILSLDRERRRAARVGADLGPRGHGISSQQQHATQSPRRDNQEITISAGEE